MIERVQLRGSSATLTSAPAKPIQNRDAERFAQVLESQLRKSGELRFSAHAQQRLESRGIDLSSDEMAGIGRAVEQAAAKGSRESLVLTDRVALVVNVPNRTVITALANNEARENVFTNIDSAVVVPNTAASPISTETERPAPALGGLRAADRLTRRMAQEL